MALAARFFLGSAQVRGGNMTSYKVRWSKFYFLAVATFMTGCGEHKFSMSAPYKAVVLAFTGKDANGRAEYALAERTFRTLTNFNELDGTYLSLRRGGRLTIKDVNGSLVSSESFSGGQSPDLRYQVKSGTAVSLDYSTLAMLSAYYQVDEIYSTLEEKIGVVPSDLQSVLPAGKHTMLFEPEIKISGPGRDVSAGIKLNAAYSPADKKFLLFQRSPIEAVPLAANFQVVTHEYGHFIFDYSFQAGKYDANNRWNDEWALNGLNEGFADFISWSFTDSTDILRSSIDIDSLADERDFGKTTFVFQDLAASEPEACKSDFYCLGSLFARSLYETQQALKATVSKKDMALGTINAIKKCQEAMGSMSETILPPKADTSSMSRAEIFERDGKITGAFLRAFVQNAPAAWKVDLCSALKKNFGTSGFPQAARDGSCD
jgi:hypothetical protein